MNPPETQYAVTHDGLHIAYQISGEGDVDLVLMQGAVAHLELAWEDPRLARLFERLSSFARLIRFDRRGMGMSDPVELFPSFEDQVRDFETVMDAAGSQTAAVMGTIDAGLLAMAFAEAYPERCRAVIAFETAPRFTASDSDEFGVDPQMMMRMVQANQEIDLQTHLSIVAPERMNEPGFPAWFRRYNRAASSGIQMPVLMMNMMAWDITDRLPNLKLPVLVLHKQGHSLLPIRSARALAASLPNAKLVELSGTGTVVFAGDVDAAADEVEEFLTGNRPPPRRDRILSTVLFTDIVGSTERASEMGDRDWRRLLDRHNHLLRESISRFGGREISTAGDGFLATFDSPLRAIQCARSAGDSVRNVGVEIRAGVHTGEIELSEKDVHGIAVHIGARIASLAGAGEVLVSSTVKDLVAGSGVEFEDRGSHTLKGVPGEWRVFAARVP